MQKKKLIYLIPGLGTGGTEVALLSALPALNRQFDFRLVCLSRFDPAFIDGLPAGDKRRIITYGCFPFNYLLALLYVLRFNPDVIVTSLWKSVPVGVCATLFRPHTVYVSFIHSAVYFHFADRFFTRLALRRSGVVFCDSVSSQAFVRSQYKGVSTEVISFLRFSSPVPRPPATEVRLKALYIGRFHAVKRIDRLLLLVNSLRKEGLPFHVDLYGRDDGTMDDARRLITAYGLEEAVSIKGEVPTDQVPALFPDYDFYFQTSDAEGMAMSVAEAMQHGLVCVVTPAGEIRNYARDGVNALLLTDDSGLHDTVARIRTLCADPERMNRISEEAWRTFASCHTFSRSLIQAIDRHVT